jgi:transposase
MTYQEQAVLIEKQQILIQEQAMKIRMLEAKVDVLLRRFFGKSGEQLDPNQLTLLMEGLDPKMPSPKDEPDVEAVQPRRRAKARTSRRQRLPEHLPIVEEIIDPLEVRQEPDAWRFISQEETEQLEYEPSKMYRRKIIRRRFVKKDQPLKAPVIAPLAPRLLEGSILSPSLLAHIITRKFCYHLPLYRQETMFLNEHRVALHRQTLCRWMWIGADWLQLIYDDMRRDVWRGGYVQLDETPVEYLCPGHGQTKIGYLWASCQPRAETIYQWFPSRAAECLKSIIPREFDGLIQCDGYSAYDAYGKTHATIEWAGCWAHARRDFYEAREQDPRRSAWVLRQIQHLYAIEERLRRSGPGARRREAVRQAESLPIVQRLGHVFEMWRAKKVFLPQSGLGKALTYGLNQWQSLQVFLKDGRIEIDNNRVENAIRPTAVGKKNWLFFGTECSGQTAAILYTLVESCRCHQIDPESYFRHVLTLLPAATTSQIKNLTPKAIARAGLLPRINKPSRRWSVLQSRAA